jgi:hypothetical protein
MNLLMQRRLGSAVAAAGSISAVVLGMAIMDDRVRGRLQQLFSHQGPSPDAWAYAHQVRDTVFVTLDAVRDQSIDHAPLTIFALAATVLLLFMLRT